MQITGPDGKNLEITVDNRAKVLATTESMMHLLSEEGRAWTLPFTQTGAANTTDNAVFHFKNTADKSFDIHRVVVSSAEAGLWSIYSGRTYSSGGTTIALRQMNVLSGKTQSMTAYYGTGITLAGTATGIVYMRVAANVPTDLLANTTALQIEPSGTFEIRFQADAGSNVMGVNVYTHGLEPWEE